MRSTGTSTKARTCTGPCSNSTAGVDDNAAITGASRSPADFYGKNKVTLIVAAGAGGGNDYIGRIFASVWPDYVPGGAMVVKNMSPPVGILGLNYLTGVKPDGLSLAVTESGSGLLSPVLLKDPAVKYDPLKFFYIGGIGPCPAYLMMSKKLSYNSAKDLIGASGLRFGATGAKGDAAVATAVVADLLGMKGTKIVAGYASVVEIGLAMGRGEIDGAIESANSMQDWIDKGYGKTPLAAVYSQRSKWFPDAPAITELAASLTPAQKANMGLVDASASVKVILGSPGVPQDKINFLTDIYAKICQDKGFLSMAKRLFPVWDDPLTGDAYANRVKNTLAIPPGTSDGIIKMIDQMSQP